MATNNGLNITSNAVFDQNATIGAGDNTACSLNGNVIFYRSAGADLTFTAGSTVTIGGTTTLDGAIDNFKINLNTALAGPANDANFIFTGNILSGAHPQSLNLATSSTTTGTRLVTLSGNATFGATTFTGANTYALQITADQLTIANNKTISSTDQNIILLINTSLNLGGTSVTVNTGGGNFQIAPAAVTRTVEFAPASTLIGQLFVDSRFQNIVTGAGHYYLGQTTQTGNIYLGNSANSVTAAYLLEVLQSQAGAGNITFYNSYDSSAANKNLILTAGTGGLLFGNTVPLVNVTLGTGSFTSNATSGGGAGKVQVVQNTTIAAGGGISFTGSDATVNSSAGNYRTLSLQAGNANVQLSADVGTSAASTSQLGSLTVNTAGATGSLSMYQVFTRGSQSYFANGGISLQGLVYETSATTGAAISFTGNVNYLGTSLTVQTNGTSADSITFNNNILANADALGPVNLLTGTNGSLAVTGNVGASAANRPTLVTLGAGGNIGAYAIGNLYSTAGLADNTSGITTVNGTAITISGSGSVAVTGGIQFANAAGLTVTTNGAAGSNQTFGSFIRTNAAGSHYSLDLEAGAAGNVTVTGLIGEGVNLAAMRTLSTFKVNSAAAANGTVTLNGVYTSGAQNYGNASTIGNTVLRTAGGGSDYQSVTSGTGLSISTARSSWTTRATALRSRQRAAQATTSISMPPFRASMRPRPP